MENTTEPLPKFRIIYKKRGFQLTGF